MTAVQICLKCQGQSPAGSAVCQHCGGEMSGARRPHILRKIVLLIGLVALLAEFAALMGHGSR